MTNATLRLSNGDSLRLFSLAELEKNPEHGSVWVVNTSKAERRGDVVITIARNNGIGNDTVVIPATWIPLDLTTMVSRPQLLRDNQFRQALLSLLTLVHPDDCVKLFAEDEEARAERLRLSNYMLVGPVAFQQQQAVSNDVEVFGDTKATHDLPGPVHAMLQRIELAHKDGTLDDEAEATFVSQLRNMGELSDDVLKHVYHATAKLAPSVSKAAKKLAGK